MRKIIGFIAFAASAALLLHILGFTSLIIAGLLFGIEYKSKKANQN